MSVSLSVCLSVTGGKFNESSWSAGV